ncbi:MAG: DUF3107 domain-containing protein [Actinomycetales bacterium]|nr:DUF3107 domain-containing protein [Actinomycetales bacterium]
MEITIGIQNVARELTVEVTDEAAAIVARATEALRAGEPLSLVDEKGQTVLVPSGAVGYLIVGAAESRRVGFGI